jgi:DNA-binding NarL/FixJ family response regulator
MAKILIADDHPFTLMGTKAYIEGLGHRICDLSSNGISAYNMIMQHQPDIAILDMSMPSMTGLEVAEKLKTDAPYVKIILLTMHKERSVYKKAQKIGIQGYVLKEFATDVLEECIDAVLKGEIWTSKQILAHLQIDNIEDVDEVKRLSFAERKVAQLISEQKSNKQIAETLFLAEKTVENHRSNILKKLNLSTERNALLLWTMQHKEALGS